MNRRMIWPLVFGLAGVAALLALGVWQVQRLAWKQAVLAEIEARIAAPPVALPAAPDPTSARYLPVTAAGRLTGEEIYVLASARNVGAIYRVISVLQTGGRRVLVDRGYIPADARREAAAAPAFRVTGNLHWPREVDRFTPDPDTVRGIWFARDVPAMAAALGTEPVLIVAREESATPLKVTPLPVGTRGIPNNHLQYAITWFSLAAVWAGMTGFLMWRIRQRTI